MLAHYITGKTDVKALTKLTITSVDTRETLLQNNTVDAVFATYSITPERAQKVAFAGPYYQSGDSIMVKKDNDAIKTVDDLNGKTVATESNSTAALAVKKVAPKAKVLLFKDDAAVRRRRPAGPCGRLRPRPGHPARRRAEQPHVKVRRRRPVHRRPLRHRPEQDRPAPRRS